MKKNDIIMIILVICVAGAIFGLHAYFTSDDATYVTVTIAGKPYGTYDLQKDQEVKINDTNVLRIRDGVADMISANCRDQICVNQKEISHDHETIVCLPNKVIVEVKDGSKSELDAVAN